METFISTVLESRGNVMTRSFGYKVSWLSEYRR